jgi:hypothetical protein
MNEEGAKFKYEKQLPPEEGKKKPAKRSSKKPWKIQGKWKDGILFNHTTRIWSNGSWREESNKQYTYDEIIQLKEAGKLGTYDFWGVIDGPHMWRFSKYKTLKSAMEAWETSLKKDGRDDRVIYWIENTDTGEIVEL